MSDAGDVLMALGRRVLGRCERLPGARAGAVIGSVAGGAADGWSDLDLAVYYDTLPDDAALTEARTDLGAAAQRWAFDHRDRGSYAEGFELDGVEVQIAHSTIDGWHAAIDSVLVEHVCDGTAQKALDGLLGCVPVFGAPRIAAWQQRLRAYPPELGVAMVRHHLRVPPLWGLVHHFETRDAEIWYHATLVEACHALLGMLAGLNRVYFSTFQFKRMGRFVSHLSHCPPDLAARLDALFALPKAEAGAELERLVTEVAALLRAHLPEVDVGPLQARVGWRPQAWMADPD